ncbi:hypothetical protein ERICIV_00524 [Paenibacillus larvae subsp. larvae]|uniref:Uncharacterized protein n=2 Tax=Paenibacillus larvae TaxID=1464 RepID=A0A2L1U2A3_9BACL|nr:hypothetical protein [Paenibacillus larvae]AQT85419.1 hypothetical protein B1222_15020 [Paenibacillus larvae subsp. pulvifaciens]AQZ45553.1 hypothetical protein B5S25_02025 [Paenibacillus larvae subsp. pulvifaciens]AQZ47416.1 hypothetical protein B5S25_13345 [Paenibacillus larvae subsp. pulvifaciens]AVF24752.1 hypothetical protein ERICIII_00524 [Paenibacillus larvae subsp. larvae]AVF27063.1 hypothetical protein ERICIII_02932 [Paenibacillus larvae subsp. larvae]
MQVGNRVLYDQDGEIIFQSGEMQGDVLPRKNITKLDVVDFDFGSIDYTKYRIVRMDTETKKPILEEIQTMTPEKQQVKEVEDALLLASDKEAGGIL